jgi:phospholysine phosphohistidine inorganic pyrophosphate phosphatase
MQAILFDLDGVLYNSEEPIEGAAEALAWVRARAIPHLFVTNTTSRGRSALVEKLGRFGIDATEDMVMSPCVAAANWLRQHAAGPLALFLPAATHSEFAGLECVPETAETGAAHVIIGDLGRAWDFAHLNRAFRLLHSNPDAMLVALGMTRFWKARDGISLDVAPFVAALEHATGRAPVVFGKPAAAFFAAAAEKLALPPGEILMVGDDVHADVGGAMLAGLKGALVRTGKFRPSDLTSGVRPDVVIDSVAALPAWWDARA